MWKNTLVTKLQLQQQMLQIYYVSTDVDVTVHYTQVGLVDVDIFPVDTKTIAFFLQFTFNIKFTNISKLK